MERPINTEALTSWVPFIPLDLRKDMHKVAPMLKVLGYDPDAYPPNYGEPDQMVKDADSHLKQKNAFYQERKPRAPVQNRPFIVDARSGQKFNLVKNPFESV